MSKKFKDKEERLIRNVLKVKLTHSFPMHPFSTPWKHQKCLKTSDLFSGYKKGAWEWIKGEWMNGLSGQGEEEYNIELTLGKIG